MGPAGADDAPLDAACGNESEVRGDASEASGPTWPIEPEMKQEAGRNEQRTIRATRASGECGHPLAVEKGLGFAADVEVLLHLRQPRGAGPDVSSLHPGERGPPVCEALDEGPGAIEGVYEPPGGTTVVRGSSSPTMASAGNASMSPSTRMRSAAWSTAVTMLPSCLDAAYMAEAIDRDGTGRLQQRAHGSVRRVDGWPEVEAGFAMAPW